MPDRIADVARAALNEITDPAHVGDEVGRVDEGEGVVSVQFATTMRGYPGWVWTVSVASLPDEEPSVLEAELLPADGALLAPEWIPWSERLAEWKAQQLAAGAEVPPELDDGAEPGDELDGDELDDDDLDDDESEDDDDDLDEPRVLHGGDLDGVDIDEADPEANLESDDD
jgi:hypothetical protein